MKLDIKKYAEQVASNDIVIRAAKTFLQAFVAGLLILDNPLSKSALVGLGASALSATWNSLKEYKAK